MITLTILPQELTVVRLTQRSPAPAWAFEAAFCSLTRTDQELSLVVDSAAVPAHAELAGLAKGWRALRVKGALDFSLVGIVAGLSAVLAAERISIFVVSTYDTDYVLVPKAHLARSIAALKRSGYVIED